MRNTRRLLIISLAIIIFLVISETVIYQQSKVKHLAAVQRVYDLGTELMNEGKYLEAFQQLSDIDREDTDIYEDAQVKIKKCKEQYIKSQFDLADKAIQQDKLKEAIKYIDEVSEIDSDNKEANLFKAQVNLKFQEEALTLINNPKKTITEGVSNEISPRDAVEIVENLMNTNKQAVKWGFECTNVKDDVKYQIVYSYKNIGDYTAILGWYYVDVKTAKVFEYDKKNDALISLN